MRNGQSMTAVPVLEIPGAFLWPKTIGPPLNERSDLRHQLSVCPRRQQANVIGRLNRRDPQDPRLKQRTPLSLKIFGACVCPAHRERHLNPKLCVCAGMPAVDRPDVLVNL